MYQYIGVSRWFWVFPSDGRVWLLQFISKIEASLPLSIKHLEVTVVVNKMKLNWRELNWTQNTLLETGSHGNKDKNSETRKQRRKMCEKAGHYPLFFFFFSEKCVFLKSWISIINLVWIHSHIRASYFDYLSTFNIFIFYFIKKVTTCKMTLTGTNNKNKSK